LFESLRNDERPRLPKRRGSSGRPGLDDEARFLKSWIEKPLQTGALMPSGRFLSRAMAVPVDPSGTGPVIELGPGTGPVTDALIRRGVAPERLVLVEYNPDFCIMLRQRYPGATIVQGDAYRLGRTLADVIKEPAAAIVSSLPLLTKPVMERLALFEDVMNLMAHGAPFVQFTYGVVPPIPPRAAKAIAHGSQRIWLNLPPARVWTYRRP
jgi:phosphatidylethanolamine/phosphatidyl-N-methylethanolamine N-methyltransferase